jgi:hypothetical protein
MKVMKLNEIKLNWVRMYHAWELHETFYSGMLSDRKPVGRPKNGLEYDKKFDLTGRLCENGFI